MSEEPGTARPTTYGIRQAMGTERKGKKMYGRYLAAWLGLVVLAFFNAAIRQVAYATYVGELAAHQISTLTLCVLVGLYAWALGGIWRLKSPSQALGVGLMWMVLTIAFEFGFGHYVVGDSWDKLLRAYNILDGRVWGLFILWVALAPYVFYRTRA
jgi:hypothetical protein